MTCVFCKIVDGSIPSNKVYEDAHIMAFHDLHPKAPVHVLVIPKIHVESLMHLTAEHHALMGDLTLKLPEIAKKLNLKNGFRIAVHTGALGGQEVFHLHYHILGQPG
jgi:histidine triad (HIT) family protein